MRYYLLDPLRGIAALWVFAFHYRFSETFRTDFSFLDSLAQCGHLGVPMFFVISGYCLAASAVSAIKHNESATSFIYRRALRIFPPYWCSIIVVASLPFIIEFLSSLKTGTYLAPSSAQSINYGYLDFGVKEWIRFLTLTQIFSPGLEIGGAGLQAKFTTLNSVYWTLALEFQFYLAVMLALLFRRWFFTIVALLTLVSVPLAFCESMRASGIFLPYWPMFALGIVLFWFCQQGLTPAQVFRKSASTMAAACICGLILLGIVCALKGYSVGEQGFAVCFALFLWFLKSWDERFAALTKNPRSVIRLPMILLMTLGAMSYSVYLLHGRLRLLVGQFTRQVVPINSLANDALIFLGTYLLCYLFYRYCEAPFIRARAEKPNCTAIRNSASYLEQTSGSISLTEVMQ